MRKRRNWRIEIESDELVLRTPLFLLWISAGAIRPEINAHWWGIEFCCCRRKPREEGMPIFRKEWRYDFRPLLYI